MSQQPTAPESGQPRLSAPAGLAGRLSAPVVVQFVKFGIVGVSNTLLTLVVYTVLLKVFGVWYLAASAIGFIVGATNGFLLNRKWTFKEHVGDQLDAGQVGDRPDLRPGRRRGAAVRARARRAPGQAARAGVRDGGRDRDDLLCQPRLDLQDPPRDHDGVDLWETVARRSRSTVDIAGQPGSRRVRVRTTGGARAKQIEDADRPSGIGQRRLSRR